MSSSVNNEMRELDSNKQLDSPSFVQHSLRVLGHHFHRSDLSEPIERCNLSPPSFTVALKHLPITTPNKVKDASGRFKPSPEDNLDKQGLYKGRQHQNESVVDRSKHGYICSTQMPSKVMSDHLSVNTDTISGSVIRWTPGSHLLYFMSSDNLAKGDGKRETMRESMDVATQSWQSTVLNLTFQETRVRKEATFVVFYDPNLDTKTYAVAFFPGTEDRYIRIGPRAFRPKYIKHMSCVLGHELGHVLGLRHEYWKDRKESDNVHHLPTEDHDDFSIMNTKNVHDLSLFVLSPLDCANIKDLYDLLAGPHTGFTITNCDPVPLQRYRISFSSNVGGSMRRRSF
jgi:hypothetical protein